MSEALLRNPNRSVRSLSSARDYLEDLIEAANPVRAARRDQIGVFASLCAFSCVDSPKKVSDFSRVVFDPEVGILDVKALASINGFFSNISRWYPRTSFGDLINVATFLFAIGRGQAPQAAEHLEHVDRLTAGHPQAGHPLEHLLCFVDMYAARHKSLPIAQRPRFAENLMTAFRTGAEISEDVLAKFVVTISDLPLEHRELIFEAWSSVRSHFRFDGTLFVSMCSMVRQMEWVQGEMDAIPAPPEVSPRLLKVMLTNLEHIDSIAELVAPSEPGRSLSVEDLESVITAIESGVAVEDMAKIVGFSRRYGLTLAEVPSEIRLLPPDVLEAIQCSPAPGVPVGIRVSALLRPRPLKEVLEIASMVASLNLSPGTVENMRFITAFVELRDRSQVVKHVWNSQLAQRYAERCAGRSDVDPRGGFTGVRNGDVAKLHVSFSMFKELTDAHYEKEDALRISWHYANHERFSAPKFREVIECLFDEKPRDALAKRLKELAQRDDFSDQDFSDALNFAKDVFPADWRPIRALALTAPKAGLDAPGLIRGAMKGWNGSSMTGLVRVINHVLEVGHAASTRADLLAFIQAPQADERKKAGSRLSQTYRTDTGPYPIYLPNSIDKLNPLYKRMLEQVKGVYRGVFDMHYGFGHLTYECQKPPGGSDWMIVRFGLDASVRVDRLNATGREDFPGPGCWISGLRLDRLFAANPKTPHDPYSLFKAAWPWAQREFEDLETSRFLFSRGVRAIIGPSEPKYHLDGVHYSLVAWNEHFKNEMLNAAALVPTEILFEATRGRSTAVLEPGQIGSSTGDDPGRPEYLTFDSLVEMSEERGLNILNLGWPSNLGGLCNAYPPCSAPYFLWEPGVYAETRDHAGHVHKSHILGRYISTVNPELDELMEPMREAHTLVHRAASAYLNLNDLFSLSLALWHKGLTITEEMGEEAKLKFDQESDERSELGEHELRMLREAHLWNGLHGKGIEDRNAFPVLCIAKTLDHWNRVRSPVVLDTFDMSLKLPGGKTVQLVPGTSGTSGFEVGVWSKHVRPLYYSRADLDLRFLDRRSVTYDPNYDAK